MKQQEEKLPKNAKASESTGEAINKDFKKMSYSRMLFSGLGNLVLLVICFYIHWSLGALFLVFWLFVLPYLDLRRLRKYEAENPSKLPESMDFDDSDLFDDKSDSKEEQKDNWKSWNDWDDWKEPDDSKENPDPQKPESSKETKDSK